MYYKINYLFVILIILCLFKLLDSYLNNRIVEHYYTYFLPFLDLEKIKIANFYDNNEFNTRNFTNKFIYSPLNIIFSFNDINNYKNYNISFININQVYIYFLIKYFFRIIRIYYI